MTIIDYIRKKAESMFFVDNWKVAVVRSSITSFLDDQQGEAVDLPIFSNDTLRCAADPFGLEVDGDLYVLFEEYNYRTRLGHISYVKLDGDDNIVDYGTAIKESFHMSYPYIVEEGQEIYCVPETSNAGGLFLYRAVEFPGKWVREKLLIDELECIDASVFNYGNSWWIISTASKDNGFNRDLYIFYSDSLKGPWRQHSGNPVKSDVSSARPGGTPFVHNGVLYRPAQNSMESYGHNIVINRVTELTRDGFAEEEFQIIGPSVGPQLRDGLHTLSSVNDNITLLDSMEKLFVPKVFFYKLFHKLKRHNERVY